ncbi:MAG: hypothetical protein KAS66_01455 [Candidatus Omnitrophica bacterium]|nr:hypothetical protein [Candidatus Omnitrophota bacterium]
MFKDSKRKSIFHVNKFQKTLFFPAVFAFIIGCSVAWLSIVYSLIGNYLSGPGLESFQGIIPAILAFATVLMIALVFWTLNVTTHYFGAYERIIQELDEILAGQGRGPVKTRCGDVIFEELLKRINSLIERMQ